MYITKQIQIICRKQTSGQQWGEEKREGQDTGRELKGCDYFKFKQPCVISGYPINSTGQTGVDCFLYTFFH